MWYIIKFQRLKSTMILGLTEPQTVNKNNGQKCMFMWCPLVVVVMFNGDNQRLLRWQWQLFINIYFHVRIQPWGHPSKFWSPKIASLGSFFISSQFFCLPSLGILFPYFINIHNSKVQKKFKSWMLCLAYLF